MKPSIFTDEDELITKAVEVLIKELGPVEASRFLTLPKKKRTESVKRHRQWQAQLQGEEFFDRVFGPRTRESARDQRLTMRDAGQLGAAPHHRSVTVLTEAETDGWEARGKLGRIPTKFRHAE